MSPVLAFVLGLLIGWLIEWVIDWFYWRRRWQGLQESCEHCKEEKAALEAEIAALKQGTYPAGSGAELPAVEVPVAERAVELPLEEPAAVEPLAAAVPAVEAAPDDLIIIKGIGPVIARLLNQNGIFTFEQLAAQTPESLRSMLGDVINRLADEASIIEQARQLAERKRL